VRLLSLMIMLAILFGACATTPSLELPAATEKNDIAIAVAGILQGRTWPYPILGLFGVARNNTGKDLSHCIIIFDLLDEHGAKVGEALAATSHLDAAQEWHFKAYTSSPSLWDCTKKITIGRVQRIAIQ